LTLSRASETLGGKKAEFDLEETFGESGLQELFELLFKLLLVDCGHGHALLP